MIFTIQNIILAPLLCKLIKMVLLIYSSSSSGLIRPSLMASLMTF